jgi:hypothetical protein
MAKRKRRNKDLQNNTQKTENQATYTPLKTGSELGCTGNVKKLNMVILSVMAENCNSSISPMCYQNNVYE